MTAKEKILKCIKSSVTSEHMDACHRMILTYNNSPEKTTEDFNELYFTFMGQYKNLRQCNIKLLY